MGNGHNIYMDDKRICIFIKHNGTVFKENNIVRSIGQIRSGTCNKDNKESEKYKED